MVSYPSLPLLTEQELDDQYLLCQLLQHQLQLLLVLEVHLVQDHWALGSFEGGLQVVDNVVVVQIKAVTQDVKLVLKQVHEMEL